VAAASLTAGVVTSLWSINEDRNSWIGLSGKGWVKLSTSSESGIMALTALAAHAKAAGRSVSYQLDSGSGQLTQLYVW